MVRSAGDATSTSGPPSLRLTPTLYFTALAGASGAALHFQLIHPGRLAILHAKRMLMVLWSVDTSHYTRPGVSRIIYTAVSGAPPGAGSLQG
jgi:hypothetical protein